MAIRNIRRQATNPGAYPGTPDAAPIYVDSDDNKLKMIPAGSGTTEVDIVDVSSTQTLTNKTLTSPTLTTPGLTSTTGNLSVIGTITSADATTPIIATATGKTNTGYLSLTGKTSGSLKVLPADAMAQIVTIAPAAQTSGASTLTIPDQAGVSSNFVFDSLAQTLTNKTITNSINAQTVFCTTQFDAVTGTTGATLTDVVGMGALTVVAGGTYLVNADIPCVSTANSGIKLSLKYTTATMTSLTTQALQWTAASALTQEANTAATDQPDLTSQTAAITYVHITGKMVVNAGGTVKFQAAQNAAHVDTTSVLVGASLTLTRVA